ncbi:MAG: C4-dicarboxylate transporter DcuC [Burkholderiaceae bacterium]|nr:C4-dicarboxylate transporter DcuC [Burkholderiaceae bacterium]
MFGILMVVLGVFLVGYLVVKKYYAPWALFLVGLILLTVVAFGMGAPVVKKSTGSVIFDIMEVFTNISKSTLGGLGIQIMLISGFAAYLDHIGATKAFVNVCSKPLSLVKSPYVLLASAYIVGQSMNIFIPSAVGLGVLLMLTIYPLLMAAGVSRFSAVAVIVTASCLDLGPASANSILGSKLSGLDVMTWFIEGQIPVAICTMTAIAVSHFYFQRYFDRKDLASGRLTQADFTLEGEVTTDKAIAKTPNAPVYYALLPVLPIALLFVFSKFGVAGVKLSIQTCIVTCVVTAFLVDLLTRRNLKACIDATKTFFVGMGKVFGTTVALIICAGVFAEGLKLTGGINAIISAAASMNDAGGVLMLFVMCGIMIVAALVTGSGNAAFFAFSGLLPAAAKAVGWQTVVMACPVQLVAGIARSMSPIAGVMIAVSAIANCSPFDIARRTIPVMTIATIVCIGTSLIFL